MIGRQLSDKALQRCLTPINPRRKINQTIKECFLLKICTVPVIFKQSWSTDAYKESCKQEAINTAFFSKLKNVFKASISISISFVSRYQFERFICRVGDLIIASSSPQRRLVFQTTAVKVILVIFELCSLSFLYSLQSFFRN